MQQSLFFGRTDCCSSATLLRAQSRIGRQKLFWLAGSSLIVLAMCLGSSEARAQACGPLILDSVTCTLGGNPYSGGISYDTFDGLGGAPINLTLAPGVNVV